MNKYSNQLYLVLEKNDMYKYQFGFRKGYFSEQAVLEITENLNSAIDNKIASGLFLVFSRAFDTVNHDILLSKLCIYGICGSPSKWFQRYLCNRTQYVKIDEVEPLDHCDSCSILMICQTPIRSFVLEYLQMILTFFLKVIMQRRSNLQ